MPQYSADHAPYPKLMSEDQILISDKHGLRGDWELLRPRGNVHSVYRVGDVVVRVPRDHPEWIQDTHTEAVALFALRDLPVATPKIIAFDEDRDVADVPFTIIEFFKGAPYADWDAPSDTLFKLGEIIASLHTSVTIVDDPEGRLDAVDLEEPRRWLETAALTSSELAWAEEKLNEWEPLLERGIIRVFVHNDLHELNILCSPSGELTMIDWGDAGWGDPSFDFAVLPPTWLRPVLQGYSRSTSLPDEARARIAWNQLGLALRRLSGKNPSFQKKGRKRFDALRAVADQMLG